MTLVPQSELRRVTGINVDEERRIKDFLQGAVYSWAKNRPGEQFAARDLFGGENTDWSGTPLQVLYTKHINNGKSDQEAFEAAGKDLGWLLKTVLAEDDRDFEAGRSGQTAGYRWI